MKLTVAICTWNRSALLAQTLERMCALDTAPDFDWELLVVNNNCTDDTDSVLARFADRLPLRRLFEPRPGQSHARNCATAAAAGSHIVWTDDDVLPDPRWLIYYRDAFANHPRTAIFGGPVAPWFEVDPPAWLLEVWPHISGAYAMRDLGDAPVALGDRVVPYGANFAVRTDVQREYPYDPNLGLKPGSTMRGDETTLLRKMIAAGHEGLWVPQARVQHFIPRERLTSEYLRSYFFGSGEYDVIRWRSEDPQKLSTKRRWLRLRAWRAEASYQVRSRLCRPEAWVKDLITAARYRGRLAQLSRRDAASVVTAE